MRLFAVNCLLLAISTRVSALPMQRVIDPSMMRAPEVAAQVAAGGGLDHGLPLSQCGLVFKVGSNMPHFTAVVWVRNSSNLYTQPVPFLAPERATQRAVGTTFLGPVSGTGSQTWAAAVPGVEAFPAAHCAVVAYNLTCEAECTVTVGTHTKTHAAGEVRGAQLFATPGADVTVTTTGAWALEMAVPQYARCYSLPFHTTTQVMAPVFPGAQWGVVFCEATIMDGGGLQLAYRTYYPDGCPVVYAEATGETVVYATTTSFESAQIPKHLLCAPFALTGLNLTIGDSITAYGLKAWPRLLTEAERRFIIRRDRERMLLKGHLTDEDVMHGAEATTYGLRNRAATPVQVHSPGLAPPLPFFDE